MNRITEAADVQPSLLRLNLGCGLNPIEGWINIDSVPNPSVDVLFDLDRCSSNRLPFEDNSVDQIYGSHFLEHIHNPLPLMQELHRVSKPGALAQFSTPYGSSDDAFEDPTHCRQMFLGSWNYFAQPIYWRADYGYRGDWQPEQIRLSVNSKSHAGQSDEVVMYYLQTARNVVLEMTATLRCIKPIRPNDKTLLAAPRIEIVRVQL